MNKMIVTKDNQTIYRIEENKTYEWIESTNKDSSMITPDNYNKIEQVTKKEIQIEVKEGVKAKLILLDKDQDVTYTYQLGKKSKLEVSHILLNSNMNITVNLEEESKITYHLAETNTKEVKIEEKINHQAANTTSNIYNHALSKQNLCKMIVDGIIPSSSNKCICNQENKIICMEKGKGEIKPNLYIDNYDVVAKHSAFIGKFNSNDLFYLASRGLSLENSYRLLIKGFLYGKMDLTKDLYEKITNQENGR